jgi:hypothetical protein
MSTVTISRQLGSLGTGIAHGMAENFKYEYVGKKKVTETLSPYGLFIFEMEKFDERKPSFGDSLQIQKKKFIHIFADQAVLGMAGNRNEKHPANF